jgi:capsule polysaccharide export protein KpsE/RkpR
MNEKKTHSEEIRSGSCMMMMMMMIIIIIIIIINYKLTGPSPITSQTL